MRGQFRQPGHQTTADGDQYEQHHRRAQAREIEVALEGADDDFGDEHGLADDQSRAGQPEDHHRREEETGGAGVPQQARVDGFHVKQPLPGES